MFETMDSYYSRQAIMPHFTGHSRQRGSRSGHLALGVGRVALPFAKKVLLPAVQSIGKELFGQSLPKTMEVATKEKSLKRAAKAALKKMVQKQIGGGGRRKNRKFRQKRKLQRNRSDFFSKIKNVT